MDSVHCRWYHGRQKSGDGSVRRRQRQPTNSEKLPRKAHPYATQVRFKIWRLTSIFALAALSSGVSIRTAPFLLLAMFSCSQLSYSAAPAPLRGSLLSPAQATASKLKSLAKDGINSAVLLPKTQPLKKTTRLPQTDQETPSSICITGLRSRTALPWPTPIPNGWPVFKLTKNGGVIFRIFRSRRQIRS